VQQAVQALKDLMVGHLTMEHQRIQLALEAAAVVQSLAVAQAQELVEQEPLGLHIFQQYIEVAVVEVE
jgi:hypothetical protein